MQVHNLVDWRTHLETLREWKARDASAPRHHPLRDERTTIWSSDPGGGLDSVQLNYSIANRAAEPRLLPLAADRGIAVPRQPAVRRRWAASPGAGAGTAGMGRRDRLPHVGAGAPEVRCFPSGGDVCDSWHQPPRTHAREGRSRHGRAARCGNAREDGARPGRFSTLRRGHDVSSVAAPPGDVLEAGIDRSGFDGPRFSQSVRLGANATGWRPVPAGIAVGSAAFWRNANPSMLMTRRPLMRRPGTTFRRGLLALVFAVAYYAGASSPAVSAQAPPAASPPRAQGIERVTSVEGITEYRLTGTA